MSGRCRPLEVDVNCNGNSPTCGGSSILVQVKNLDIHCHRRYMWQFLNLMFILILQNNLIIQDDYNAVFSKKNRRG